MTVQEIKNLNREELIQFAQQFNIWKNYTFPEYLEKRQAILEQMQIHNITMQEVQPVRTVVVEGMVSTIYK